MKKNNIKVLLINPETPEWFGKMDFIIPTGVLYLASILKENNIDCKLLDLNIPKNKSDINNAIIQTISEYLPTLIGISCPFSGLFPSVLLYSQLIKDNFKDIKIVLGGIHPTLFHKEIIENCNFIDFVIRGEGEIALLKLVKHLLGCITIDNVPALTYKIDNKVIVNIKTEIIEQLNFLPKLDYNFINVLDYYHNETLLWHNPKNLQIKASLPIITSRGCPMNCNFCCLPLIMGKKWRYRNYMDVVNEMEMLYNTYNHTHFSFMDDNLTLSKKHVMSICNEIIKRNMNIQFETPNGISTKFLDEEILDALCLAGLVRVALAIESGNEYIRNKIMDKKLSTEQIYKIIELTKKYKNLQVRTFFIFGMPEDTKETLQDTYDMIVKTDVDFPRVFNVIPFPGTALFDQCIKDNLFINPVDLQSLWNANNFFSNNAEKRYLLKRDPNIKQIEVLSEKEAFYIKPYKMEILELLDFRNKIDNWIYNRIREKYNKRIKYNARYSS